jgi:transposase-like protein
VIWIVEDCRVSSCTQRSPKAFRGGGRAAAIPTDHPRSRHQRCWCHKMRSLCNAVRHNAVKQDAQRSYQGANRAAARRAFKRFRSRCPAKYSKFVTHSERDLLEMLTLWSFHATYCGSCAPPMPSSGTRRRTPPMVVFTNLKSADRVIWAIFSRFNDDWKIIPSKHTPLTT